MPAETEDDLKVNLDRAMIAVYFLYKIDYRGHDEQMPLHSLLPEYERFTQQVFDGIKNILASKTTKSERGCLRCFTMCFCMRLAGMS